MTHFDRLLARKYLDEVVTASSEGRPQRGTFAISAVVSLEGSGTAELTIPSYATRVGPVTIHSSSALNWESYVGHGLRIEYSTTPGVFLAGHGSEAEVSGDDVAAGLLVFAQDWVTPDELEYLWFDYPFPKVLGWRIDPDIIVGATTAYGASDEWVAVPASRRSVSVGHRRPDAHEALLELFERFGEEEFEFGEEADFDNRLATALRAMGVRGLSALSEILMDSAAPTKAVAVRSIYVVSRTGSIATHEERLHFLTAILGHGQPSMRDAAALGLYDLGSPDVVAPIRAAIAREESPFVRKNLKQILDAVERRSS